MTRCNLEHGFRVEWNRHSTNMMIRDRQGQMVSNENIPDAEALLRWLSEHTIGSDLNAVFVGIVSGEFVFRLESYNRSAASLPSRDRRAECRS